MKTLMQHIEEKLIISKDIKYIKKTVDCKWFLAITFALKNTPKGHMYDDFISFEWIDDVVVTKLYDEYHIKCYAGFQLNVTLYNNILWGTDNEAVIIFINPTLHKNDILKTLRNYIKYNSDCTIKDIFKQMNMMNEYKYLDDILDFGTFSYHISTTDDYIKSIITAIEEL